MENLASITFSVCMTVVACGLIGSLFPKNASNRTVRQLMAGIVLLAILYPLAEAAANGFSPPALPEVSEPPAALSETLASQIRSEAASAVENLCTAKLGESSFVKKVEAVTDISETGVIYIKQIKVYVTTRSVTETAALQSFLSSETGYEIEMEWMSS